MRYDRLLQKFKDDPEFYRAHRARETLRTRKYNENQEFKKAVLNSNAAYRAKIRTGTIVRPYVPLNIPITRPPFEFKMVKEISVSFD